MKWLAVAVACGVALFVGTACVYAWWINPRVVRELQAHPDGERAQQVMLLTLR